MEVQDLLRRHSQDADQEKALGAALLGHDWP